MVRMIIDFAKKLEAVINYLPPIPVVVLELLRVLDDENSDLNAITRVIGKDPSMSMNILKVANSAFYRLTNKVATVDHAVKMLGIREVTMICVSCAAYHVLRPPRSAETFSQEEFWKHSVATGVIARKICRELSVGDKNVIYFGGLLHDIGKIVLDRFAHDIYKIVIQLTHEECLPMIDAEKRIIGEGHDMIGGLIMEKWKFPWTLVNVTRYHHAVGQSPAENRPSVAVCSLADQLARVRCFGFGGDMSGIVLTETEAFKTLAEFAPAITEMDVFKFVCDLESVNDEIVEMEQLLTG